MTDNILINVGFIMSMIGAVIATICYAPGAYKVFKTNDTRAISLLMYILTSFGCFLWVIISILYMIGYSQMAGSEAGIFSGCATLISNLGLGSCSIIILSKKISNMNRAKKANLTEDQYFKNNFEKSKSE